MTSESEKNKLNEERLAAIFSRVGPRATPSTDAESTVKTEVYQAWRESVAEHRRQRRQWSFVAVAASLLVALVGALVFPWGPAYPSSAAQLAQRVNQLDYSPSGTEVWQTAPESAEFVPGDRLRLAAGSYAALTMTNGTELRLDQSTELRFISEDSVFLLRGALYADARGESTLRVLTEDGTAQDIGTRFEVRITEGGWLVQVREGRVVVDDQQAGTAFADAGERLVTAGDSFITESLSPYDASWSWTQAVLRPITIEGTLFEDYLDWWSRESGVAIDFQSAIDQGIAGQTRLHGSLDGLSLEDGLGVVLASSGYRVVHSSDERLILTR